MILPEDKLQIILPERKKEIGRRCRKTEGVRQSAAYPFSYYFQAISQLTAS
jgi:hypothetical protein